MSAQDSAAEIFGSDRMWGLKELPLPEPVSLMPQTWGWAGVTIVMVGLAGWQIWRMWRQYTANQYRRDALYDLDQMSADPVDLQQLPGLLRRAALAAAPRGQVASLRGQDWITWLNERLPEPAFDDQDGSALEQLAYAPSPEGLSRERAEHLLLASKTWIRGHNAEL